MYLQSIKLILLTTLIIVTTSCTSGKVAKRTAETGYFPSTEKAIVLKSEQVNLDKQKTLLLVPNDEFTIGMLKEIDYFDKVIDFDDLEKLIVENNLGEKIPSIDSITGINKAAKVYQNFLWLTWRHPVQDNRHSTQLVLIDAETMHELFLCETERDSQWDRGDDQSNSYPMMNALVDYIGKNSTSYTKK